MRYLHLTAVFVAMWLWPLVGAAAADEPPVKEAFVFSDGDSKTTYSFDQYNHLTFTADAFELSSIRGAAPTLQFMYSAYAGVEFGAYVAPVVKGDANSDGAVNISDIAYVIDHIREIDHADFNAAGADANSDGTVDITDVLQIIMIMAAQ